MNRESYGPITFHVSKLWPTDYAVRCDDLGADLATGPTHRTD